MKHCMAHVVSVAALLSLGCVGDGAEHVGRADPSATKAEQAESIAAAKEAARAGVITDIYAEWATHSTEFEVRYSEMLAAVERRNAPGSGKPVRTLDELIKARDPAGADPELRAVVAQWEARCADYEERLRELGNDPRTDPRRGAIRAARSSGPIR